MTHPKIHPTLALAFALVPATLALAQAPSSTETVTVPVRDSYIHDWQFAQQVGSSKRTLVVVTLDRPDRGQACHIRSFTQERLVCSYLIGNTRTYLPQQVLALIVPGDNGLRIKLLLGFNAGLGASIWGTVVLAAACPACAAATGVVALLLFGAAGAICYADGQPERLLYLAAGQQLSRKFKHVEPLGN